MKRSMSVLLSLLLIAALSACAPKGTPTPSVADLQATAMANAKAQIALTAASVPTATPLPPTPMPTPIPVQPTAILQPQIVAPTQPVAIVAPSAAAGSSSGDPCNGPLSKMKGPHVEVTFKNTTKGDLSFYLYINENAFGCGVGNVNIAPLESVTTSVPKGCYDFYGWVNGPKNSTPAGSGCLNFNQTVIVGQDNVVFQDQKK